MEPARLFDGVGNGCQLTSCVLKATTEGGSGAYPSSSTTYTGAAVSSAGSLTFTKQGYAPVNKAVDFQVACSEQTSQVFKVNIQDASTPCAIAPVSSSAPALNLEADHSMPLTNWFINVV
jgi:hypothetical protein